MCDNLECLSSQVGMDAGLIHPCFFAFLAISISIFNIFKYYFYTSVIKICYLLIEYLFY